jgi:hypothetical protein
VTAKHNMSISRATRVLSQLEACSDKVAGAAVDAAMFAPDHTARIQGGRFTVTYHPETGLFSLEEK